MKRGSKFLIIALSTIAMAGTAAAQDDAGGGDAGGGDAGGGDAGGGDAGGGDAGGGDAGGGGDMGGDMGGGDMGGAPPMLLPKGKLGIMVSLQVSLLEGAVADPLSIQPDVWYGVMPKLEVGLAHSSYGISGFWGSLGGGICVGDSCGKAYNGPIGVLAHFLLMEGGIDLALDAGVIIRSIDPMALGVKAGVMGRKLAGKLMIGFKPNIYIGLTERDGGNKEVINVPVDVHFMASPKLGVGVQTGITGPLDGFGDGFSVPVSIGAVFMATPNIMAGASFNLFRVAGFEGPGAADLRGITVFAGWHN